MRTDTQILTTKGTTLKFSSNFKGGERKEKKQC